MFGSNWVATYFNSIDLSGPVIYAELFPNGIDINWGLHSPHPTLNRDNFSGRFTSEEYFDKGTYEFVISSYDGVRVFINNRLMLDRFVERELDTDRFLLSLEEGNYSLKVEYFSAIGLAALRVQWFRVSPTKSAQKSIDQTSPRKHENLLNKINIFIVHGHDDAMREEVTNFIREIGHIPIVLHERPNLGRTIIEKFEQETADISFAIVLLSPDDVGAAVATPNEPNPRARQNVILELGYFVSKLGRDRVCLLYKGSVETPSDLFGVLYIRFDPTREWKQQLIREMEAVRIPVKIPSLLSSQSDIGDITLRELLLPNLRMPKAVVEEKLKTQIEKGREIAGRRIRTVAGLDPALVAQEAWNAYNLELLSRCFDGTVLVEKYREVTTTPNANYQRASRGKNIMRSEIEKGLRLLSSILQRVELLPDINE